MIIQETVLNVGGRVDEEAGVIRDVKLLGRESANGRTYTDRAMGDAARCYENINVNINHPKPQEARSERGLLESPGIIRNARHVGDEVRGDFHYLKSHPAAPIIVESAQRFPNKFGFSHNAEGETRRSGGKMIVEGLTKVHSVDLVTRPATTKGLFESESNDTEQVMTLQEIIDQNPQDPNVNVLRQFSPDILVESSDVDGAIEELFAVGCSLLEEEAMDQETVEPSELDDLSDEELQDLADAGVLDQLIGGEEVDTPESYGGDDDEYDDEEEEEEVEEAISQFFADLDARINLLERRELLQDMLEQEGLVIDPATRAYLIESEDAVEMAQRVASLPRTGSNFRATNQLVESEYYSARPLPESAEDFARALKY